MPILVDTANAYSLGTSREIFFSGQQLGDLTLVFAGGEDNVTLTISGAGWSTAFNDTDATGDDKAGALWYKFFETGDDTSPAIGSGNDRIIVVGAVYRGVSNGIDDFDWNKASASHIASPPITATVPQTLALSFEYHTESPDLISSVSPPTGYTTIESRHVVDFGDHVAGIAVKALPSTGTETPAAWTLTGGGTPHRHYGATLNLIADADELEARTVPYIE